MSETGSVSRTDSAGDAPTLGVIRVLTLDDADEVALHGRLIEERFPDLSTISRCIPDHPDGIPTVAAEEEAIPLVVRLGRDLAEEVDALCISCALDPGVDELRETVEIPVIGAGRSIAFGALAHGEAVGTLTLEGGVPPVVEGMLGDRHRSNEIVEGAETTNHLTSDAGRQAIVSAGERLEAAGCDVIAPCCTGVATAGCVPLMRERVSIPVINPVHAMGSMLAMTTADTPA